MTDKTSSEHTARHVFAKNMRTVRRLRDISQESLAFDAEVSRVYISEVERGTRAVSIDVMGKIADALCVPLHQLLRKEFVIDDLLIKN